MSGLLLLLLPLWGVLLIDGGLKLFLLAVRFWGRARNTVTRTPAAPSRWLSIAVVVPAYNEEGVIGETVRRLGRLRYPVDRFMVLVIADGCTDETAARAQAHGARCVVREAGAARGKGRALSWLLTEKPEALGSVDVVLVCDADSRLHADALRFLNEAFLAGCQVAQTRVVRDFETSSVGLAVALPEAWSQEIDDRARSVLGWSVPLRGTGMAFQRALLAKVSVRLCTKAEDLELSLLLALAKTPVVSLPESIVYDPKPAEIKGAARQRARWLQGQWEVTHRYWREIFQIFRHGGERGARALLFALLCRPRALVMGAKAGLAGGGFLFSTSTPFPLGVLFGVGASVAFLADLLYYLVGFLFLSRGETRGAAWRALFYLPIWLGAVALSLFSSKKWLSVRERAGGR